MKRFKNILYYAEGEKKPSPTLARTVELAKRNEAKLTLIDVTENLSPLATKWLSNTDLQALLNEHRQEQIQSLANEYASSGVPISTKVCSGISFVEVIKSVLRSHHDLVVKAAQRPGMTVDRFFGSTDLHLFRKCPCPVWIDRPNRRGAYQKIMAAVDTSDDAELELNRLILDLATSLASKEFSELHVVHVWRLEGESMLRYGRGSLPQDQVDEAGEKTRQEHQRRLDSILANYTFPHQHQIKLIKGWPARAITKYADDQAIELLVMGTIARMGIPGFFIGNTAENVLNAVRCAVLAVKPSGFTTPVKL